MRNCVRAGSRLHSKPNWKMLLYFWKKEKIPYSSELILATNAPPWLLIIKRETKPLAGMFNLLWCQPFEGWLYGNCSLVLYIYRCTLCQGQGNCVWLHSLLSAGSVSEVICETGQIKLVHDVAVWQGWAYSYTTSTTTSTSSSRRRCCLLLTNYPKPCVLSGATSADQLLTLS